jgi:uncharacterized delta-60 repeat protein
MWLLFRRQPRQTKPARRILSPYRPRLEALEDRCLLSAGALDPTFGSGGTVTTALKANSNANALAIYPVAGTANDGKIVVVGSGGTSGASYVELARYNANGTLDGSFGSSGKVQTKYAGGPIDAVAIQPDGKIVVGGEVNGAFFLTRYNANGSLDSTFGSRGTVITSFAGAQGAQVTGLGVEILNGVTEIVAAGYVTLSTYNDAFALARYNLSGGLDTGLVTDVTSGRDDANAVVIQPDGKIVVAGNANGTGATAEFAVARYNPNGSLDSSFGSGGTVQTPLGGWARGHAVALQPDGKIVVAGQAPGSYPETHAALARYNAAGTLDTTFGSGAGYVVTPLTGTATGAFEGVVVQSNGQIVAVGVTEPPSGNASALARYNADGTLDSTFGQGGIVAPAFGSGATAVALQADGKIVVASLNGGNFGVARYLPSEPEIGSFTASPNPVAAGSPVTLTAGNLTDGNPNSAVTQVAFYRDGNGDGVLQPGTDALLGYGTRNPDGTWTLTFSTAGLPSGTDTLFAQAEDNYGVFGDPLALALSVP